MNIEKQIKNEFLNFDSSNEKIYLFKKEFLLKKIFLNIFEFELKIIEIQNEIKNNFSNEEINYLIQLFFYIISNNKTIIILNDFYKFLKENKINFNISNLKLFFISINNKNDNLIDLNEFSFLFNFQIKKLKFVEKFEKNFYFNEFFIKIILLNLNLFENLQILLNSFYNQFKNFSPIFLFNEIKNNNKNFIDFNDLNLYLKKLNFNENEIKIIFNKIKSNFNSNEINFKQFSKFFNLFKFNSNIKPNFNENPFVFDTNEIIKIIENFIFLNEKNEKNENKNENNQIENEIFIKIIKFIIELDSNVENILKNENFYVDKLFKSFIKENEKNSIEIEKNSIEKNDFYNILKNKYKININKKTLNLIFSKYSNDNFNMNFDNFLKLLKIKIKNFDLNKINNINENLIKKTLEISIKNEIEIENKISKLNKISNFNLSKIFEQISNKNNFISKIDLENYFNLTSNQTEILFNRLDFNNDNKISYEDFLKNLYPTFI